MSLLAITDRTAISRALEEFDRLGREAFLAKYGFGRSRRFFVKHRGKLYDSKAIVGAAHGYQWPKVGALGPDDFHGGEATVQKTVERLGFEMEVLSFPLLVPRTSEALSIGELYTREDLQAAFAIKDATLFNGVFRLKGSSSVWLFVTSEKTRDRTEYADRLDGEFLYWQGQTSARTDKYIVEHVARGLEILVFYRQNRYEHPGAAFRLLGNFRYVSHTPGKPSDFVLQRTSAEVDSDEFDASSVLDSRFKTLRSIRIRQGQSEFRSALVDAYGGRCAVTGCNMVEILEAAHIHPYRGEATNHVTNGILLRSDLHVLFDLGHLWIEDDFVLSISARLNGTEYEHLRGKRLRVPHARSSWPSASSVTWHRENVSRKVEAQSKRQSAA